MADFDVLHQGAKSAQVRNLAIAMNQGFATRSLADRKVHIYDGPMTLTGDLHAAAITCAWALGASQDTINRMRHEKIVPKGVNRMIRSPGARTADQLKLGQKRVANLRHHRAEREKAAHSSGAQRHAVCEAAKKAAANYRREPGNYHYLAGGKPNTVIIRPTPRDWRSDCSQFVVNCYREAGSDVCPGSGSFLYSNTISIEGGEAKVVTSPRPGDLGLYGRHGATHHVEMYIGEPGCEFIGHGSPPMDSLTPGRPDFYLSFLP